MDDQGLTFKRTAMPLPKAALEKGAYYIGVCRNANVARWDGEKFWHWRVKWGRRFLEEIRHREDDKTFDVFDAWARVREDEVATIDLPEVKHATQDAPGDDEYK